MITEHPVLAIAIPFGLMAQAIEIRRVGSLVTCSPTPEANDADFLVLVKELSVAACSLDDANFVREGYTPPNGILPSTNFLSYRRGEVNILITDVVGFFSKFCMATDIAARLNLQSRDDRKKLFQAVLYGV